MIHFRMIYLVCKKIRHFASARGINSKYFARRGRFWCHYALPFAILTHWDRVTHKNHWKSLSQVQISAYHLFGAKPSSCLKKSWLLINWSFRSNLPWDANTVILLSRKYISECRLQNGSNVVSEPICWCACIFRIHFKNDITVWETVAATEYMVQNILRHDIIHINHNKIISQFKYWCTYSKHWLSEYIS